MRALHLLLWCCWPNKKKKRGCGAESKVPPLPGSMTCSGKYKTVIISGGCFSSLPSLWEYRISADCTCEITHSHPAFSNKRGRQNKAQNRPGHLRKMHTSNSHQCCSLPGKTHNQLRRILKDCEAIIAGQLVELSKNCEMVLGQINVQKPPT